MNCDKIGKLIYNLRKEKAMTQKQLADLMNISDKTISKWERGLGCPDVSLLSELSQLLGTNIEEILSGKIELNETIGGNMKKLKFYVCPQCNNFMTAAGDANISCWGKRLETLVSANLPSKIFGCLIYLFSFRCLTYMQKKMPQFHVTRIVAFFLIINGKVLRIGYNCAKNCLNVSSSPTICFPLLLNSILWFLHY